MNKKFLNIYFYPLLTIILSLILWYLFTRLALKIDIDSLLYQSLECKSEVCVNNFKIFFISLLMLIYAGWVFVNMWLETSKSVEEKEKKIEKFFMSYGKAFAGLVVGQFLFILLAFMIF